MDDEAAVATVPRETFVAPAAMAVRDLRLVAENPNQLANEQTRLIAWCKGKIADLRTHEAELSENLDIAKKNKWRTSALSSALSRERGRISYYEKMQAALEAGYFIVPNFEAEVFAVRTAKALPPREDVRGGAWNLHAVQPPPAPLHEGRYVSATPAGRSYTEGEGREQITRSRAENFIDEINFPFALAKAQVLTATQAALALKVFDDLAVLPARVRHGDPMVVGIIRRKEGWQVKRCTFLVAWFLDTETL